MDDVDIAPEDDGDVYNTPNTTRVDEEETSITPTSTLRLNQQVLRNKLDALYRHLGTKGSLDFVNLDRFKMKTNSKTGITDLLWYNGENWVSLTNQRTGEFLAVSTLKTKFGGLTPMKNFLNLEQTPPSIDRSIKAAALLKSEIPTQTDIETIPLFDLSSVVEDIRIKTREASQNTDLDMREFLGISKALQSINGELRNNTAKLSELDKRIKQDTAKLKEIEDNPEGFSEEKKELYKKRLQDLQEERQARLEFLLQNRKDLQTQEGRIKKTIEKILNSDTSLGERIRTLFREQGITIFSVLTAVSMLISTIVLAVTGGGGATGSPPKDEGEFRKWLKKQLNRLANALKRIAGKAVAALPGIIGSVVGAILNFLGKTVGFLAQHIWALIAIAVGLIGAWLIRRVQS